MVRTRANNAAVRKAVVAKAPRKQLAPVRSAAVSPGSSKGKKGSKLIGGNSARPWPTPTWQKGIDAFLASSPSRGGDGECSSGGSRMEEEGEQGSSSSACASSVSVGASLMDDGITQLGSDSEDD